MALSFASFAGVLYQAIGTIGPRLDALELASLTGLWFCSVCFLVNRYGTARRAHQARGAQLPLLRDTSTPARAPHVTVLIPSYCEEPRVIRMTLLSAALAVYPSRNIVVLLDDPVGRTTSVDNSLQAIDTVRAALTTPLARFRAEHRLWLQRRDAPSVAYEAETERLRQNYLWLAAWLETHGRQILGEQRPAFAHIDQFFATSVLDPLVDHYRAEAAALARIASAADLDAGFGRLATAFCPQITSFQRKQFENLSHVANKAMNLNTYIGLMGGSYRRRSRLKQLYLKAETGARPDLVVTAPDYVLTLDADSMIRPNYIDDMVAILEGDRALAVAQTPYLAFPGATMAVERFAGATTDIQYLVHQGSTAFNASYWVGANALIRYRALQQIRKTEVQDGKTVSVFIQDRTVIEDTGSTIDLLAKGWGVYNHYAPLAYSATPSDFGALCIQRKRWCNGGLIIVGDVLRALIKAPSGSFNPASLVLRLYYLLSPLIGNLSLFLLMVRSRPDLGVTLTMVAAIVPYFLLYSLDLRKMGYRLRDVFPVTALNLLLLPVAFAGILESLVQMITGRKTSFARTPKVEGRTGIPGIYVIFYMLLLGHMAGFILQGLLTGDYWVIVTPLANSLLILYGLFRFIGPRNAVTDTMNSLGLNRI